jgi:hypothetical protein
MSSKMFLSALAGVAAIAVVAAPQDPSFEYPGAKHIGFDVPKDEPALFGQATERVSVSFKNASLREVLDWLKNAGVSFVVGDDQVNKDSKTNINIMNQPVDQLMRALASSWGGHWEKQKDIWVFKKGQDVFGAPTIAEGAPFTRLDKLPETVIAGDKAFKTLPGSVFTTERDGKVRTLLGAQGHGYVLGDHGEMTKEQEQALQKSLERMNDPKAMEEFKKSWEKWAKEYEQNFKEFEKNWQRKNFEYKFDEKALQDMQKKSMDMAKAGKVFQFDSKNGGKGMLFDGKEFKPLDEKMLKEMEKHQTDMAKRLSEMRFYTTPDVKVQKSLADAEVKIARARAEGAAKAGRTQVRRSGAPSGSIRRFASPEVGSFTSEHNLKAIYETLTPAQEIKLKRLGYINYSDLNSKQRALLGVITDDGWTISYKTDKADLTIKSDR